MAECRTGRFRVLAFAAAMLSAVATAPAADADQHLDRRAAIRLLAEAAKGIDRVEVEARPAWGGQGTLGVRIRLGSPAEFAEFAAGLAAIDDRCGEHRRLENLEVGVVDGALALNGWLVYEQRSCVSVREAVQQGLRIEFIDRVESFAIMTTGAQVCLTFTPELVRNMTRALVQPKYRLALTTETSCSESLETAYLGWSFDAEAFRRGVAQRVERTALEPLGGLEESVFAALREAEIRRAHEFVVARFELDPGTDQIHLVFDVALRSAAGQ